jgi:hypothetical protein
LPCENKAEIAGTSINPMKASQIRKSVIVQKLLSDALEAASPSSGCAASLENLN